MDDKDREFINSMCECEQSLAFVADQFPPQWKRMYANLLSEGFPEDKAFKILLTYIHGQSGGKLMN